MSTAAAKLLLTPEEYLVMEREADFKSEYGYFDTLLNPTVIVEVLSPSTENYDRNEKFMSYQALESLQEYILISQHGIHVEQYFLQNGEWILKEYLSLDNVFQIASIECQLALRAIYAKVQFS